MAALGPRHSCGSLLATLVFFVGRSFADVTSMNTYEVTTVTGDGMMIQQVRGPTLLLPAHVHLPVVAVVAVIAAIVVGATFASTVAMRKVRISPFGVARTVPPTPPTSTAAVLFLGGTGGLLLIGTAAEALADQVAALFLVSFMLFVICVAGLMMGSASLAAAVGRFLAPRVSRPDLLIASRRMIAAPFTASRGTSSVLLVALIGAAIQGTRASFLADSGPSDTFYAETFTLIDGVLIVAVVLATASLLVTSAEAIVERPDPCSARGRGHSSLRPRPSSARGGSRAPRPGGAGCLDGGSALRSILLRNEHRRTG